MINWKDPATIISQSTSFVLLQHGLAGVYLWEFFTNLDYDWRLIRKQRKVSWTPLVYLVCRVSGVAEFVTILAGLDVHSEINCQAWLVSVYCFAYLSIYLSSMLIAIRVIAIWYRNKIVMLFAGIIMLGYLAAFVHGAITAKSVWEPLTGSCLISKEEKNLPNVVASLSVDLALLLAMFAGLFRRREARKSGVWKMLWHQGVVWVFLATVAEVPTVVFLSLNLNTPMNLMFFTPEMVILLIGSTRMYRTLSIFLSPDSSHASSGTFVGDSQIRRRPARSRDTQSNAISMVPLDVAVQEGDSVDLMFKDPFSPNLNYNVSGDYTVQAI